MIIMKSAFKNPKYGCCEHLFMIKLGNRKYKTFIFIISVTLWKSCEVIQIPLQKGPCIFFSPRYQ